MGADPLTEQQQARDADIDLLSTAELVALMNGEDALVPAAVGRSAPQLAAAIDAIVARLEAGGRLVYAGAGTSGRIALVDAAECAPTFGLPPGTVSAVVAGSDAAEDDEAAGAADVAAAALGAADALVAVSASGRTPYTLGAAGEAAGAGALVVAVVAVADSPLVAQAHHAIVAETGAEVIAGSTRLKAGTAQKLILNTISTVAMIRLGRTYGNLMVGVVAGNSKLKARARRVVELATDVTDEEIDAALVAAGGDAKVAIVSIVTGLHADDARRRLDGAGGVVRRALEDA